MALFDIDIGPAVPSNFGVTPVRGHLKNLHSGESFVFPMNPTTLRERIQVRYQEQNIIGMSHPNMQYLGTGATKLPGVQFYYDARRVAQELGRDTISPRERLNFWRFVQALTVPGFGADDINSGQTPRVLFVWPQVMSLTCVVQDAGCEYREFDMGGAVLVYVVSVSFAEIRDLRMYSEELRIFGSDRGEEG